MAPGLEAMVEIASAFVLAGTFLAIGFLADLVFERTGVPDLLIMILLGALVGPVSGLIDRSAVVSIIPLFSSLAIAVILFDGGLNLRLRRVLQQSPRALILALLGVTASMLVTTVFTSLFLGWRVAEGALLGAVIGGSSSAVVIPLLTKIKATPNTATLLSLESVFTDAIVVVVALSLLQFLTRPTENLQIGSFAREIAGAFLLGAVIGFLGGIAWIRLLKTLSEQAHRDVLTLGIVLLVYGFSEGAGGNGAISSLIFGLVLGNGDELASMLRIKNLVEASVVMKRFQGQISFLIRTFFFALLGIILVVRDPLLVVTGAVISLLLLGGRYLSVVAITFRAPILQLDRPLMTVLLGRGLSAAVLANLVAAKGIEVASALQDITLQVIILTVVISAVGIHYPKLASPIRRKKETNP